MPIARKFIIYARVVIPSDPSTASASVRQRALLGFAALAVYDSELLTRCIDKLPHRLQDSDVSVRAATLDLLFVCFQV